MRNPNLCVAVVYIFSVMFKKIASFINQSKDQKLRKQLLFSFGRDVPMEYLDTMFRYIKFGNKSSDKSKD